MPAYLHTHARKLVPVSYLTVRRVR